MKSNSGDVALRYRDTSSTDLSRRGVSRGLDIGIRKVGGFAGGSTKIAGLLAGDEGAAGNGDAEGPADDS